MCLHLRLKICLSVYPHPVTLELCYWSGNPRRRRKAFLRVSGRDHIKVPVSVCIGLCLTWPGPPPSPSPNNEATRQSRLGLGRGGNLFEEFVGVHVEPETSFHVALLRFCLSRVRAVADFLAVRGLHSSVTAIDAISPPTSLHTYTHLLIPSFPSLKS